jgi:hypothetical protein
MAMYVWDFVVDKPAERIGEYYTPEHRERMLASTLASKLASTLDSSHAQAKTDRDNTDQIGCKLAIHTNVPEHTHAIRADMISSAMTDRGDGNRNGCAVAEFTNEDIESMESACPYDELIRKLIACEQNRSRWGHNHVLSW